MKLLLQLALLGISGLGIYWVFGYHFWIGMAIVVALLIYGIVAIMHGLTNRDFNKPKSKLPKFLLPIAWILSGILQGVSKWLARR